MQPPQNTITGRQRNKKLSPSWMATVMAMHTVMQTMKRMMWPQGVQIHHTPALLPELVYRHK